MKMERLLAIVIQLLNNDKVTANELAEKFEVSVRTIQRDMDTITMAGIPIVAYRGQQGGYGLIDTYKIDKSFFTPTEYTILLTALKGVYGAYDDEHLKGIIEKLTSIKGTKKEDTKDIIMDLTPWGNSEIRKERIKLIKEAIHNKKKISFQYVDLNGRYSERIVEPLTLILKVNVWYLHAYCCLRQDYRLFKISRIRDLVCSNETYERSEWKEYEFDYSTEKTVHLEFKFHKSALNRLDYYFELEDLKIAEDGYIYVSADFPEDEWVYGMILSYGDQVEVLKPEHIRDIIKTKAKNIYKQYD